MSLLSRNPLGHPPEFRRRRFLNWFPLGLTYATMYMGRYNFNVVKNDIGALYHLDKAQMGLIATFGFWTYGLSVMINGPLADRIGGRKAILIGALGAGAAQPGRRPDVLQRLDGPRPLEHELALEPEHVLPELRRALGGQGQQHLVPRARARHLRRHLRHHDLVRLFPGHHDRLGPAGHASPTGTSSGSCRPRPWSRCSWSTCCSCATVPATPDTPISTPATAPTPTTPRTRRWPLKELAGQGVQQPGDRVPDRRRVLHRLRAPGRDALLHRIPGRGLSPAENGRRSSGGPGWPSCWAGSSADCCAAG